MKLVPYEIIQALYYTRKLRFKMRRRIASRLTFNNLFIILMMEYLFYYFGVKFILIFDLNLQIFSLLYIFFISFAGW